jgi:clan AA aspartic protease (TIGR02281 family)
MKRYRLEVRGGLFFTRASLKQDDAIRIVSLLIDTGATYTILSWAVLVSLGLDPAASTLRKRITTASGLVLMPAVSIERLTTLGQMVARFSVLAHTIPLGSKVDGVLGMDFLRQFDIKLNFKQAIVEV